MPNKAIISPEQKKKSIRFLVVAATGDLGQVIDLCDDYNLNQSNSKGNTALHLACENNHNVDEVLTLQIEEQAKDWAKAFFAILEAKIQVHEALKAKLETFDIAESTQCVRSLKLN